MTMHIIKPPGNQTWENTRGKGKNREASRVGRSKRDPRSHVSILKKGTNNPAAVRQRSCVLPAGFDRWTRTPTPPPSHNSSRLAYGCRRQLSNARTTPTCTSKTSGLARPPHRAYCSGTTRVLSLFLFRGNNFRVRFSIGISWWSVSACLAWRRLLNMD